jgi:hypothetical protein
VRTALALAFVVAVCGRGLAQENDPEQTERADRAIAQKLDIDYKQCSTVLLGQQFAQLAEDDVAYVSIIGEDPDAATLAALRRLHGRVEPYSKMPSIPDGQKNSHTWAVTVASIKPAAPGEYVAVAAYHCGSLCAGATEYRLSKSGKSCSVLSSRLLWVS